MPKNFSFRNFVCSLSLALAPSVWGDPATTRPGGPELSGPQAALVAFIKAKRSGNFEDINYLITHDSDESSDSYLAAQLVADEAVAYHSYFQLLDDSIAKFGMAGNKLRSLKETYPEKNDVEKEVRQGTETTNGDNNSVIVYKNEFDRPITVRLTRLNDDDEWRVYFPDLEKSISKDREKYLILSATIQIFGETSQRVKQDLSGGKFNSVDEAIEGFKKTSIVVQHEFEDR